MTFIGSKALPLDDFTPWSTPRLTLIAVCHGLGVGKASERSYHLAYERKKIKRTYKIEVHDIPLPSFDEKPPFPQTRLNLGLGIRGSWT